MAQPALKVFLAFTVFPPHLIYEPIRSSDLRAWRDRGGPVGALLLSSGVATRWYLLTILTGSYGAGAFGMLGISPLSPSLVEGFGLTRLRVALHGPVDLSGRSPLLAAGRAARRSRRCAAELAGWVGWSARAGSRPERLLAGVLLVPGLPVRGAGPDGASSTPRSARPSWISSRLPERGMAMGIKQMGLTLGGIAAALVLPKSGGGVRLARSPSRRARSFVAVAGGAHLASARRRWTAPRTGRRRRRSAPAPGRLVVGCGVRRSVMFFASGAHARAWCRPRC